MTWTTFPRMHQSVVFEVCLKDHLRCQGRHRVAEKEERLTLHGQDRPMPPGSSSGFSVRHNKEGKREEKAEVELK